MILELYHPAPPLDHFIENFLYYKGYNPSHSIDRFLPDGNVYLLIDLTETPKFIYDNESLAEIQTCKKVWFSGIRNQYITIPSGRDNEMFVINFHKGKAYPFVDMPMHELTDYVVDGDLVMSPEILNLRELMLDLLTVQQKFHFAEQYLLQTFQTKLIQNPFVDYAVKLLVQSPQQLSMQHLADKVGFSQKHLIKIFKEHVGVTPKSFLKIIRFQKAIQEIETSQPANWTSIAYDSGYYDQAHFIHDFKNFSGFTPNQFLQMQSNFVNYIALEAV